MTALRVYSSGSQRTARGHYQYLNLAPTSRSVDNQIETVESVREERARRSLYAQCERAPYGWEAAVC